jgi:hypothetical protein
MTFPFYGTKKNQWCPWWRKSNAVGDAEGWSIALKEERAIDCDSEEDDDAKDVIANDIGLNFLLLSFYTDMLSTMWNLLILSMRLRKHYRHIMAAQIQ